MEIRSVVAGSLPKVGRGGAVPDRVFEEIRDLNGPWRPAPTDAHELTFQGQSGSLKQPGERMDWNYEWDADRQAGAMAGATQKDSLLNKWRVEIESKDGQRRTFPIDARQVGDLTYNEQAHKLVITSHDEDQRKWHLIEYDTNDSPNALFRAKGQQLVELSERPGCIELAPDGSLLVADKNQICQYQEGKLQPLAAFPGVVRDLNILSDGGLCVRVQSSTASPFDLYYVAPDQSQPLPLKLADVGPLYCQNPERKASFLKGLSDAQLEEFLDRQKLPESWYWQMGGGSLPYAGHASPDGANFAALDVSANRVMALIQGEDLGCLANFEEMPQARRLRRWGLDPESASWSGDGRLLAVSSRVPERELDHAHDAWVWDSQTRQSYVLPGVESVKGQSDGTMEVCLAGKAPFRLTAEQFQSLPEQAWYQRNSQALFYVTNSLQGFLISADSQVVDIPQATFPVGQRTVSKDGMTLVELDREGTQGRMLDLIWNLEVPLPSAQHLFWDRQRDHLGLVTQDGRFEHYNSDELRKTPWYEQKLRQKLTGEKPVSPATVATSDATGLSVNGLSFGRKAKPQASVPK